MTDFATLAMKIDSSDVKRGVDELDKLTSAGGRAEGAMEKLEREADALRSRLDPLYAAQKRFDQELTTADRLLKTGTITTREYAAAQQLARDTLQSHAAALHNTGTAAKQAQTGLNAVTVSAGQQRAGMQQLSFQIGDVAQQFALGARPMQIFAAQGSQVVQSIALMRGSAGGLIGFLSGPWGAVILGAATVLGALIDNLYRSKAAADQAATSVSNLAAAMDRLNSAGSRPTMQDLGAVNIERLKAEARQRQLTAEIRLLERSGPLTDVPGKGKIATTLVLKERREELKAVQSELVNYNTTIKATEIRLEKYGALERMAATATTGHTAAVRAQSSAAGAAQKATESFVDGLSAASAEIDNFFRENDPVKKLTEEWERNSPADAIIREIDRIRANEIEWERVLGADELRRAKEEADAYAQSIDQLIAALSGLGKVGGVVGGLLGIASGNIGAIGGPIGALLNVETSGKKIVDGREVARTLGDELHDIFGDKFGPKMLDALQGAGTGMLAGAAFFGNQSQEQQIGSAIGGALGKVAGKEIGSAIGGLAGKLGGPLGAIAGGVLGSMLGGLFTSVKWGRVMLSSQGVSDPTGNQGASKRAAAKAGGSFMTALDEIAQQFGGDIGDFGSIALGVRHGDWRVNANGTSLKKKKGATDFNDDAEAAISYAIQIAIERGAITGIRESTQRLLKSSEDLAVNLSKALKFENVFKELQSLTDPLGYALGELTKEFDGLRKIFNEAGASAEEYAKLEELLAIKRADLIAEEGRKAAEKFNDRNSLEVEILRLMGREEDALAAARLNELASMQASLQPLQAMVYQLQDARAIIDQFGPLADDLRKFKQEVLGGSSSAGGYSVAAAQFRSTAALAKGGDATALGSLRSTATEFLDAAKANASSALDYQRAVGEVLGAVDSGIFAADSQVEYALLQIDAINNSANIIAGMREELKAYQQQIVENTSWMARQWARFEGDGVPIRTFDGEPIEVQTV